MRRVLLIENYARFESYREFLPKEPDYSLKVVSISPVPKEVETYGRSLRDLIGQKDHNLIVIEDCLVDLYDRFINPTHERPALPIGVNLERISIQEGYYPPFDFDVYHPEDFSEVLSSTVLLLS